MDDMAREIQELRQLSLPDLHKRYQSLYGKPPWVRNSKEWLWKRISWRMEEQRTGGLSRLALTNLERLIEDINLPIESRRSVIGILKRDQKANTPAVGTTLVRVWHGRTIEVLVRENGFEWDGQVYRSLTAVAKAVTGQHWSGPLFFNLRRRTRSE